MNIEVQNDAGYALDADRLIAAAQAVLSVHTVDPAIALSIVIASDDDVAALNHQYRGIDAPTDVLSFPAEPLPDELREEDEPPYLGDMVIAYPYTQAQAEHEGHGLADMLALLVVHGTLHLLGYDHDTPEHRARMWAQQDAVLHTLQIPTVIVPALEDETL